jgi:capsular polysaccharide transport system permease protein
MPNQVEIKEAEKVRSKVFLREKLHSIARKPADIQYPQTTSVVPEHTRRRPNWLLGFFNVRFITFLLFVVAPVAVGGYFVLEIASPRYVSEFRVAVRSPEPLKSANLTGILGLTGLSQTGNDSYAVIQYLQSQEILDNLESTDPIKSIYSQKTIDWVSRLNPDALIEKQIRYWNNMVSCYYDNNTGTIIVKVTAFSPFDAQKLSKRVLSLAEKLVNSLSERIRRDTLSFAEGEVARAEARLTATNLAMRDLRDKEQILDPRASAATTIGIESKIRDEIAHLNADLMANKTLLSPDAPTVQAQKRIIAGLQEELNNVQSQATKSPDGKQDSKPLSSVIGAFESIQAELTFAQQAYEGAKAALESARIEATRQQLYLATIVPPGLPEEPVFPHPIENILLISALSVLFWVLALLIHGVIKEHV